jgi:hypothetical protein
MIRFGLSKVRDSTVLTLITVCIVALTVRIGVGLRLSTEELDLVDGRFEVTIRSAVWATLAFAVALLAAGAASGPAWAAPVPELKLGEATLQGRVIDLSRGWQDAQSCVVFAPRDVRCFATHAEADALLGYSRATDPLYQRLAGSTGAIVLAVPACSSGWLCLYADINGGGRRLQFRDEYWQYLSAWAFDRQTSSWRNNQGSSDPGHLSMYNSSSVYNCAPNSYANSMGVYNDQAYAVWA